MRTMNPCIMRVRTFLHSMHKHLECEGHLVSYLPCCSKDIKNSAITKGENKPNSDRTLCVKPASSLIRSNCYNEQGKQCSGKFGLCLTLCMFDRGQD
jgi:hypothetical protein